MVFRGWLVVFGMALYDVAPGISGMKDSGMSGSVPSSPHVFQQRFLG